MYGRYSIGERKRLKGTHASIQHVKILVSNAKDSKLR